jgi:hypothetical protein
MKQPTAMPLNKNPGQIAIDQTDSSPADNILFDNGNTDDLIEAKAKQHGLKFIIIEEQTTGYDTTHFKRTKRLCQSTLQHALSVKLIDEINSDALPSDSILTGDWLMAAKSNDKFQITH